MKNIVFFILILSYWSCKSLDKPEEIPGYLYIESMSLDANTNEGTSSSNITEAWVYANEDLEGIYELPAKIPIHKLGNDVRLKVYAGIKKLASLSNSESGYNRVRYPFYKSFDTTLSVTSNHVISISPIVEYVDDVTIWEENFEDPGIKFSNGANSDTSFVISSANGDVYEGNASGVIFLDEINTFYEGLTEEPSFDNFPKAGAPVYIEINFKSNNPFQIGIYANYPSSTAMTRYDYAYINSSGDWKKTYIDLTDIVSYQLDATDFEIFIRAFKEVDNPKIIIDNFKVLF